MSDNVKFIDGKEMHITFNGSWMPAYQCLCSVECIECGEEIDLHDNDTMGEYCIPCYWTKRGEEK